MNHEDNLAVDVSDDDIPALVSANEDVPAHQGKQRTDRAQRNRQGVHVSGLSFSGSGDYLGSARSAQD